MPRYRPRPRARAIGLGVHERRGRSSRRELSGRGEGHRGGLARRGGRGGGGGCGGGLGRAMTERFFVRIFPFALWFFSIWAHVFVSPCVCVSLSLSACMGPWGPCQCQVRVLLLMRTEFSNSTFSIL